jgi:FdhD protein
LEKIKMTQIKETSIQEVRQYKDGVFSQQMKEIIREIHLEITLNGEKIAVIACSGRYTDELTVGFLRSEGLLSSLDEIGKIEISDAEHRVDVQTRNPVPLILSSHKTIASSGARGTGAGQGLNRQPISKSVSIHINPEQVYRMMDDFLSMASLHDSTGGTHAAALAAGKGEIIAVREDIGRHNTIDMLGGYTLLNGIDPSDKTILRTGRVSSEIVHKVWRLGVPVVISISVPTTMAIELACEAGITLIGLVRGGKFIVYTHPERIGGT